MIRSLELGLPEVAPRQKCPNCGHLHDISVYVSGQRLLCRCGLHFEVRRGDVRSSVVAPARSRPATPRPAENPTRLISPAPPPVATAPPGPELAATVVARATQLPGYELSELLGRGGMGEVWKARQQSLGRTVAVKILSPDLARDAEFVRRFEKEATALAALSHPNIVQIIDRGACAATQTWFFAMELCEGASLRELMEAKELGPAQAVRLTAQVCRAIAYAHGRGVIHRDLKPENILIDAAGQAKVVDFGLAGLRTEPDFNLTRAATAMGTLHYMAPEQRRDAHAVDERADIYSLGVILYEALTGDVPTGRFRMPSEKVPGLDSRLDKITNKALQSEPDARYPDAVAMAVELEALSSSAKLPAEKSAEGEAGVGAPAFDRRRLAPLFAIVIVVGLAAGALALQGSCGATTATPSSSAASAAQPQPAP